MRKNPALWERINNFSPDNPEVRFAFTDRLMRENDWPKPYASRVIEEYKRFVYLACIADHEVTPSEDVDQVWHLHLVYTHSYWEELCAKVLQRPLHHGPTKGGSSEASRYQNNYQATLVAYAREFGTPPPADIWPENEKRFGTWDRVRPVDVQKHWVIPKPSMNRANNGWINLLFLGLGLTFAGTALSAQTQSTSSNSALVYLMLFVAMFGATAWAAHVFSRKTRPQNNQNKKNDGSGCGVVGGGGCGTSTAGGSGGDGGGGGCGGGCS